MHDLSSCAKASASIGARLPPLSATTLELAASRGAIEELRGRSARVTRARVVARHSSIVWSIVRAAATCRVAQIGRRSVEPRRATRTRIAIHPAPRLSGAGKRRCADKRQQCQSNESPNIARIHSISPSLQTHNWKQQFVSRRETRVAAGCRQLDRHHVGAGSGQMARRTSCCRCDDLESPASTIAAVVRSPLVVIAGDTRAKTMRPADERQRRRRRPLAYIPQSETQATTRRRSAPIVSRPR